MELQPLVLINAVGLTPKLLAFAPRLKQLAANGLAQVAPRSGAGRHLHGTGHHLDRRASARARDRRQRLAVPRHGRDSVLATIECAHPGRANLRDGTPPGNRARAAVPGGQALLVVQPGGGGRDQRDPQALLWGRRQQGLRHHRRAPRAMRAARARPRPLPVPHVLGTECRAPLHAVDRPTAPPRFSSEIGPS